MSARPTSQRIADVRAMLEREINAWVASASASGDAYLVPLSFHWDGAMLTIATPRTSRTARNLRRAGWARLAVGPPSDVVIVEGDVHEIAVEAADPALAEAHARSAGFDARHEPGYVFIQLRPSRIQAWRNPAELPQRDVMRDGEWLD
jgi:hypothetical protein